MVLIVGGLIAAATLAAGRGIPLRGGFPLGLVTVTCRGQEDVAIAAAAIIAALLVIGSALLGLLREEASIGLAAQIRVCPALLEVEPEAVAKADRKLRSLPALPDKR